MGRQDRFSQVHLTLTWDQVFCTWIQCWKGPDQSVLARASASHWSKTNKVLASWTLTFSEFANLFVNTINNNINRCLLADWTLTFGVYSLLSKVELVSRTQAFKIIQFPGIAIAIRLPYVRERGGRRCSLQGTDKVG